MKFFSKKNIILLLIILAVLGGSFYFYDNLGKPQKNKKSYKLKREDLKETLTFSGEINAREKVSLKFQSSGMMTWVGVKEGDYVKKYQGIASLDQEELEKNLKKYLNTFLKYRWDYDQKKEDEDIKNIGNLSEDARREALRSLDKAQFDLNNTILDVELKDIALKYAYLYTPIEGIVTHIDTAYAGVNITPATSVFEIINPKTIYFTASADQTDVVSVKKGEKADLVLDSYPDEIIKAKVEDISFTPKTGETGTVYEVKVGFSNDNKNYKYRVGMTGDLTFIIKEKKNILAVPATFIKKEKGEEYVYKIINNKKTKVGVKTGEELDGNIEIISGLEENDIIYD